jgi:hypothetical protein
VSTARKVTSAVCAAVLAAITVVTITLVNRDSPPAIDASCKVSWASGVFPGNGIDSTSAERFGAYRSCPVQVAAVFPGVKTWSQLANDNWYLDRYQKFPGRLSIGVPLTLQGTSLGAVSEGAADDAFRGFVAQLQKAGRGNSDLRLGWEFNGDWMAWSAFNSSEFNGAFRRVAGLLKKLLPRATIDWNGNLGTSQAGHNVFTELYPGNDVVDVIGVDAYDQSNAHADSPAGFAKWAAMPFGLDAWYRFAQAHGKPMSLPEWGLNARGEGDNPEFIRGMHSWLAQRSTGIAFEAYFNWSKGTLKNSLHDPVQMPKSSKVYAQLWDSAHSSGQ